MRNEWSTIRIKHKVTGSMLNKKLAVGLPIAKETESGYTHDVVNTWMHYVDFQVENQFSEYKNNALMFGRSNRNANGEYMNIGKSGSVIKCGAGLREQMSAGNTIYYNDFSLKLLEDALYEISAAKLDFGDRHFVIECGERGALLFNKAVKQTISGWHPITVNNPATIKKVSSKLNANAAAAMDYQFTEWYAPNGVHVSLNVNPAYDDPVRNKIQHPLGGPAESYRFDIFYLGTMDQANIFKCKIKGQDEYRGLKVA